MLMQIVPVWNRPISWLLVLQLAAFSRTPHPNNLRLHMTCHDIVVFPRTSHLDGKSHTKHSGLIESWYSAYRYECASKNSVELNSRYEIINWLLSQQVAFWHQAIPGNKSIQVKVTSLMLEIFVLSKTRLS